MDYDSHRKEKISRATDELRDWAGKLDDAVSEIEEVRNLLEEEKLEATDWGVHDSAKVVPINPQQSEGEFRLLLSPPQQLVDFKESYESAHEALNERLWILGRALEEDANKYRIAADNYDEDEENNLDDIDTAESEAIIPRGD